MTHGDLEAWVQVSERGHTIGRVRATQFAAHCGLHGADLDDLVERYNAREQAAGSGRRARIETVRAHRGHGGCRPRR
jgi:hypothetical protein